VIVTTFEAVLRVLVGAAAAIIAVPLTLYVLLSLTLDLQNCQDVPDQLACGSYSQGLVSGLCLVAGGLLAVCGLGLAVLCKRLDAGRWWGGFIALVVVYGGLVYAAYLLVSRS